MANNFSRANIGGKIDAFGRIVAKGPKFKAARTVARAGYTGIALSRKARTTKAIHDAKPKMPAKTGDADLDEIQALDHKADEAEWKAAKKNRIASDAAQRAKVSEPPRVSSADTYVPQDDGTADASANSYNEVIRMSQETASRAGRRGMNKIRARAAERKAAKADRAAKAARSRANVRRAQKGLATKGKAFASSAFAKAGAGAGGVAAGAGAGATVGLTPVVAAVATAGIVIALVASGAGVTSTATIVGAGVEAGLIQQEDYTGIGTLTGDAAYIASWLRNNMPELSTAGIAAVLGNMKQESNFSPKESPLTTDSNGVTYGGLGLCQWGGSVYSLNRKQGCISLANQLGLDYQSIDAQLEWFKVEVKEKYATTYNAICNGTDPRATAKIFAENYERCGVMGDRLRYAQEFYDQLTATAVTGSVSDSTAQIIARQKGKLSDRQEALIRATDSNVTPSPGAGWCAAWVTNVGIKLGISSEGNANNMYDNYCTSSDLADLKPGMIVACSTHPHTVAGKQFGHVGIYIGNGLVRDNIGYIRTISLSEWIETYSASVPVKWGWLNGKNLAGKSAAHYTE